MLLNIILGVSVPVILVLVGIIYKQNKEGRTSLHTTVNALTEAVTAIKDELQTYREGWIDRREAFMEIILNHCAQTRGSCREVIDLRMDKLHEENVLTCKKIDELKVDRNERWNKQEKLNTKLIGHLGKSL